MIFIIIHSFGLLFDTIFLLILYLIAQVPGKIFNKELGSAKRASLGAMQL